MRLQGVACRTHGRGDGLTYQWGQEYRDAAELASIAKQLPGKPVKVAHGNRIVGKVLSAHVDGDQCVAEFEITAPDREELIRARPRLSLGYRTLADSAGYQRSTEVDELSIVPSARCGDRCSVKLDAADRVDCGCTGEKPKRTDADRAADREAKAAKKLRRDLGRAWETR